VTFLARTTPAASLRRSATAALTPARLSLGRVGVGSVMLLRPTLLGQVLGVRREQTEPTDWAVQMLGAREIALGLGAWTSLRRGDTRATRLWLLAGLLSDALDAVAVAGAVGRGRVHTAPGAAAVVVATTAAAVQAAALAER
jgi:hypothetical protein